jgi:hypothetical protein
MAPVGDTPSLLARPSGTCKEYSRPKPNCRDRPYLKPTGTAPWRAPSLITLAAQPMPAEPEGSGCATPPIVAVVRLVCLCAPSETCVGRPRTPLLGCRRNRSSIHQRFHVLSPPPLLPIMQIAVPESGELGGRGSLRCYRGKLFLIVDMLYEVHHVRVYITVSWQAIIQLRRDTQLSNEKCLHPSTRAVVVRQVIWFSF